MTKYQHHLSTSRSSTLREIVFGMEDGMVSTLGAITGIGIGSQDHYTVMLSGIVIIAVESISMGIGSYLSNRAEHEVNQRRIEEEKEEIQDYLEPEKKELLQMFVRDGWPDDLAMEMTEAASRNPGLMLTEMTYRELMISEGSSKGAFVKGLFMLFSYVIGGLFPLAPYFIFHINTAMPVSIIVTLTGLFALGAFTTKYSGVTWFKAGGRVLLLGVIALIAGLLIGNLSTIFR